MYVCVCLMVFNLASLRWLHNPQRLAIGCVCQNASRWHGKQLMISPIHTNWWRFQSCLFENEISYEGKNTLGNNLTHTKPSRTSDAMQISFAVSNAFHRWQIIIHHEADLFDVDTASQNIGGDQYFLEASTETIEHGQTLVDFKIATKNSHCMPIGGQLVIQPISGLSRLCRDT